MACKRSFLDCGNADRSERKEWANITSVFKNCDPNGDILFKFGIFENALKNKVFSSKFLEKYFYCLWWGLQNLRYLIHGMLY